MIELQNIIIYKIENLNKVIHKGQVLYNKINKNQIILILSQKKKKKELAANDRLKLIKATIILIIF